MKKTLFTFALVTLIAPALQAATLFNFNTSQLDDTTGDPLPTSVAIAYASLVTEDEFGDPLANPYFDVDATAPAVTASNPLLAGYGNPIDGNAIDGIASPIMLTFAGSISITDFSAVLDDSTLGTPAFFGTAIEFYNSSDVLIGSIAVDQGVAKFDAIGSGPYNGVKKIVFASGAFYDNVQLTVVPEPSAALLGGLGLLALFRRRRA
ncbi:PEP-CTERM sorting domain-containing protein [bacterium]|nr:PEP-CTERM sorting domain-containing protein [bacterium]